MLARLESYIRQVMTWLEENYPGLVVSWDVANECIDDSTGWLRDSSWYRVAGSDYVSRAFELARRWAPEGTLLFYNDYNTAYAEKRSGILRLLKQVMETGCIDGYGFQMHNATDQPTQQQL